MQKPILIAVVVVAVVVVGWTLLRFAGDDQAAEPEAAEVPPTPAAPPTQQSPEPLPQPARPPAEPEPEIVLPPLADSDPFVRERLEPLELPETWLAQGDYVRRLTVLAENATRGEIPRRQLAFMAPGEPFRVVERDDAIYIDPASYRRYDRYVEVLARVPPETAARLLDTITPLMVTALVEIGVEAPPGEVLTEAMRQAMAVPEVTGEVALEQPNVMYTYADPDLEALTPLQKQILRMGPENVRRIKDYLRQVADALNLQI